MTFIDDLGSGETDDRYDAVDADDADLLARFHKGQYDDALDDDIAACMERHPSGGRGLETATVWFPTSRAKFVKDSPAELITGVVQGAIESWNETL